MPIQDCGSGGKRWGEQGKCYDGPDAGRKAYAQGMAMGEVAKAEFEGLWGPFTKADLLSAVEAIAVAKYNASHDDHGRFSNLDHVPDSNGQRFTLGDYVKHADTGRIGMVTETHPDPKGKAHAASVLFGDREGIFRSNVPRAMHATRVPTSKLEVVDTRRMPKAAAERALIFKDWATFDAERGTAAVGAVGAAAGRATGGLMNRVAGVLTQAGSAMAGGRNRNGFMLHGGGGGGGITTGTKGGKGGGKGRGGGKGGAAAKGRTRGKPVTAPLKAPKGLAGKLAPAAARAAKVRARKDEPDGGGDNPESIKVSYRGKNAETAVAAAHNTLHHAGIDSQLHRGPLSGPHLHVGPQSQQAGPLTYGSIGDGVAQDIQSGVKPATALIQALHSAGVVRDTNNPYVDVDQDLVDGFAMAVQQGNDPAQLAQQIISSLQNPGQAAKLAPAQQVAAGQQFPQFQKGDVPGHDFHGNQWSGGGGATDHAQAEGILKGAGIKNYKGVATSGTMVSAEARADSPNGHSEFMSKLSGEQGAAHLKAMQAAFTKAGISTKLDTVRTGMFGKTANALIVRHAAPQQSGGGPGYGERMGGRLGAHGMTFKQEPSSSDVHVNAIAGAINPGRMHKYVDDGAGRCKICNGVKDQGIHKGETIAKLEITTPIWIDKAVEKQVAYGVALHPGLRDSQGDRVTEDDIAEAAHRFMVRYRETGIGHEGEALPAVQVVESYLAPKEMTFIDNMGREHQVLKGSWILAHKHNDPEIWERVKKGIENPDDPDALGSLSIQGSGIRLAE